MQVVKSGQPVQPYRAAVSPQAVVDAPSADRFEASQQQRECWQPAIETMKKLTFAPLKTDFSPLAEKLTSSQEADGGWKGGPQASDRDTSVLNHIAITSLMRDFTFATGSAQADGETQDKLKAAVAKSWKNLTGKTPASEERLMDALPGRLLSKCGPAVNAFHEAMLGSSIEVRVDPEAMLAKALGQAEVTDQTPAPKNHRALAITALTVAAVTAAGAAVAAVSPGALAYLGAAAIPQALQFVAGLASGWANASFMESFMHDRVAHADKDTMKVWKRMGPVGEAFQETYIGHAIHHNATFKVSHVRQFESEEEKTKLTEKLIAKGRGELIKEQFGASLGLKGYASFEAAATPLYAATLGAAAMMGAGPAYFIGHAIPALTYPLFSMVVHPRMHQTAKDIMGKTPNPLRALMKTKAVRFITAYHFVHHERDRDSHSAPKKAEPKIELAGTKVGLLGDIARVLKRPTGAVNLNLFLGADFLRNTVELPTWRDIKKMRDQRMLY